MREGNTTLNKICPVCGEGFETKVVDRVFCTVRCRSQSHREREKLRDGLSAPIGVDALEAAMYFSAPVTNPTIEFIVNLANTMVIAKTSKPMLFRGVLPQVDLSNMKVSLNATANANEWIMFYDEIGGKDIMKELVNVRNQPNS